jgi:hypothetical protein
MNEHSVTEQTAEADVTNSLPRHQLDEHVRMRIRAQVAARAAEVENGGKVRVRRYAP